MTTGAMSTSDVPRRLHLVTSDVAAGAAAPAAEGGLIRQLAEEIVRAAVELDTANPDALRLHTLMSAIANAPKQPISLAGTSATDSGGSGAAARGMNMRWGLPVAVLAAVGVAAVSLVVVGALLGQVLLGGNGQRPNSRSLDPISTSSSAQPSVSALLTSAFQDQVAGRTDQATATYQEVLKQAPTDKVALYNLGVMDQAAGRGASAEEHYRAALSSDANFWPALFNLAIIRNAAGASTEAIDLYRRALAVDPSAASAHLNLGILLRQTGSEAAGAAEIRQALSIDPTLAWRVPAE